jgi:hypothetical protein
MIDYEKLGVFYLGREFDPDTSTTSQEPLLYDSKDLTTHAVIVGMTGSGKTGLGVTLLEEAAIDGIPAIIIDPKGDLGNLLLTFPALQPGDFRPWIEKEEADRKGLDPDALAAATSETWKKGLAAWGQTPERIQKFKDAAEVVVFTPGSEAGLPISVLKSFDAPTEAMRNDADSLRERVTSAASGLLALLGISADPLRSREHILLSTILDGAWRSGLSLSMTDLIRAIQAPPFKTIGVMDVETFFPLTDRMQLAMTINNVVASPSFSAWTQGEPLNIQRLLYSEQGRPRLSILSIAHLSENERAFFVTILLNEVITWMRSQPGTSSLRALLYMDEVFGYLPPTANPPTKLPMLTLLKQARAYGLGLVLATQNPVDLDYKALSNAGTWFLGRLQTERDKARVLDGLEGASSTAGQSFDRARTETILSGLGNRVFLMNNVHEDGPVVFQTRWALSYLRGPLTREQIAGLMAERKSQSSGSTTRIPQTSILAGAAEVGGAVDAIETPPLLPPDVETVHVAIARRVSRDAKITYQPAVLGRAKLHYVNAKAGIDLWKDRGRLCCVGEELPADLWADSDAVDAKAMVFETEGEPGATYASPPIELTRAKSYVSWKKSLKDYLYREDVLTLFRSTSLKALSNPDETEGDFRARIALPLREQRDREVEKVRQKYAAKLTSLEDKLRRAQQKKSTEENQAWSAKLTAAASVFSTAVGALFSRKKLSSTNFGKAASSVRAATRAAEQHGDVGRAEETIEALTEQHADLEKQMAADAEAITNAYSLENLSVESYEVQPRKSDIQIDQVALAWLPCTNTDGRLEPAWEN